MFDCWSTYIQIALLMFLGMIFSVRTFRLRMMYGRVEFSPVLFCIYIYGLLCSLRESGAGCYIGHEFVGVLAHADVTLLAPMPQAMWHLLEICEEYGKRFSIAFNAAKSAWLYVTKRKQSGKCVPQCFIDGQRIHSVSKYTHLGHVIFANLDDI